MTTNDLTNLAEKVSKLVLALNDQFASLGWDDWEDAKERHGVVPFAEPGRERLKYGAEIVQLSPQAYPFEPRTKTHFLTMSGEWSERGVMEEFGQFKTYSAALSALNAAPAPPGWVEAKAARERWFECCGNPNYRRRFRIDGAAIEYFSTSPGQWRPDSSHPLKDTTIFDAERWVADGTWREIDDPPHPAPQPASEGVRWFRSKANGSVREYPSRLLWRADGSEACITTTASIEECIRDGDTELDGPPPHGKPLAKPATEDAMENRAMAFVAANMNMCASGMLTNFARSEIARATASLRAEVGKQTQRASEYLTRCDEWIGRCSKVEQERDELRTRLAACEAERDVWKADAQSRVTRLAAREEALRKIAKPDVKMRDTRGIIDRYEHGFYVAEQAAMRIARAALKEPSRGN